VLPGVRGDCLGDAALKHLGHRLDSPVGSAVRDRLDDLLALAFEYVDNLAVDPCDAVVGRVGDVENVDGRAVIGRDIEDVIERGARPVAAVGRSGTGCDRTCSYGRGVR